MRESSSWVAWNLWSSGRGSSKATARRTAETFTLSEKTPATIKAPFRVSGRRSLSSSNRPPRACVSARVGAGDLCQEAGRGISWRGLLLRRPSPTSHPGSHPCSLSRCWPQSWTRESCGRPWSCGGTSPSARPGPSSCCTSPCTRAGAGSCRSWLWPTPSDTRDRCSLDFTVVSFGLPKTS